MNNTVKKILSILFCILRRTLLVVFTAAVLVLVGLIMVCNLIFNGPSPAARDVLTMSMLESSGMKWCPALFIGEEMVEKIRTKEVIPPAQDVIDAPEVVIQVADTNVYSDEWKDYPDGIRIDEVYGDTFTAYVMLIRNPADVYLATSTSSYSTDIPGTRIHNQIRTEGALAAINGGAFNDDGTLGDYIGSLPMGLTVSRGRIVWNDGTSYEGFVGFDENNVLVVSRTMSASKAKELKIRDGCCFGPVLVTNGVVNDTEFSRNSGYNPRTAIGQRADGVVIFVCVDGRQAGSLGATYADLINIMVEYGAVNACNLDGGASSVMMYRDTYGRYGDEGKIVMVNNHAILQEIPRKMPTFFMVKPADDSEE
jgi:exopolysaccharide biosynthesis protein